MMPGGIESWLPLVGNDGTSMLTDYLPTDAVLVALEELERDLDADWQQIGERHERYSGDLERPLMKPEELVVAPTAVLKALAGRSEEHTSELQSLMRISYAVFCLKQKKKTTTTILVI